MGDTRQPLWISWTLARRSRELAPTFGARFYEFSWHRIPFVRHPWAAMATVAVILMRRPRLVYVQNPSIFAATIVVALRRILRFTAVVDSHTLVIPLRGPVGRLLRGLTGYVERNADLNIVTNSNLARELESRGARTAVLPDKLPELEQTEVWNRLGRHRVVYICSFAPDEPYREVIEAARRMPEGVEVVITGNFRRVRDIDPEDLPKSVNLTGYLSDEEYANLLHTADAVMALTRVPNCMLCGAYEAVALGKPLILSDQEVLREYFDEGVEHVANRAEAIAEGIGLVLGNLAERGKAVERLRERRRREWDESQASLRKRIEQMAAAKP